MNLQDYFSSRIYWVMNGHNIDAERISVNAMNALDAIEYGQDFWNRKKGIWAELLTSDEIAEREEENKWN
jgi:hypothetical protein